jgi:deoxyribodipyrimidine photolyase-like uncharacterized protein
MIDLNSETISFSPDLTSEQVEAKIEEKWEVKFSALRETLEAYTKEHAQALAKQFITLAPYGKYEELLEDQEKIADFLSSEASQHWKLYSLEHTDTRLVSEPLMSLTFISEAVPDQELKGFIYLGMNGKIKHAFVRTDV